jgi:hypothetical protein
MGIGRIKVLIANLPSISCCTWTCHLRCGRQGFQRVPAVAREEVVVAEQVPPKHRAVEGNVKGETGDSVRVVRPECMSSA